MQSFQLIKPCFALAPYIRHYWILQDDSIAPVSERTLPIGCMQLVFHKGKQLLLSVSYTHLTLPTNREV